MPSRSSIPLRAALATLVAVVLVSFAPPEAEAGNRGRHDREVRTIRLDTNLLSRSGVSAWAIDEYLAANTSLPGLGSAFLAAERRYGINARFLLAAALHESNWGRSGISRAKHNLFGYNAYDRDPYRYATAFAGYAKGIDRVARFMKESYLTRSGRWWGGAPTLRSMQRFWSSSGRWGENVSRIANSLKLDSLRMRRIRFGAPRLPDIVRSGDELPVRLTWRGGRLPGGITYRATWKLLTAESELVGPAVPKMSSIQAPDGGVVALGDGSVPAVAAPAAPAALSRPNTRPITMRAKRTKLGTSAAGLRFAAPEPPGEYLLTITLRDRDGAALPKGDTVAVPGIRVRVFGDWAVRYRTEQLGDRGVLVTVTNAGHVAIPIPSLPALHVDRLGRAEIDDTRLVLRGHTRDNLAGTTVAAFVLTETLHPGESVSLEVADLASIIRAPDIYLVPDLIVLDDPLRLASTRAAGFWFTTAGAAELALTAAAGQRP